MVAQEISNLLVSVRIRFPAQMKERIWFLSPPVNVPTGGINNFYRLCQIAEEIGIEARVISIIPYSHPDPSDLSKYWQPVNDVGFRYDMFNIPEINPGDIIVQPEIYNWKSNFSVPVRRVTYIQNWAIASPHNWENHYWVYNNMTFMTYCIESVAKKDYPFRGRVSSGNMTLDMTDSFIKSNKLKWSTVSPYFLKEDFMISDNKVIDIVMFPRKSPQIVEIFKKHFGDKLFIVDGVTPGEVKRILSRTKIIVLPSAAEGLCFPAIEAMLSGCVVVTWNCGAPEDYVIDGVTGKLVEYGDVDSLLQKTNSLLENPDEIKSISEKAYDLITNLYTKEQSKRELLLSYYSSLQINPE